MNINVNNSYLLISAGTTSQFPSLPLPQVAFSGRSNVGKSSLIYCLLQRKSLARVSGTPGKTVTVNFYSIDKKLVLVDLPGYGFAKRTYEEKKKWSALTDGYFTDNRNSDLLCGVIQLVDSRIGPTKDDLMMLDFLADSGIPHTVVYTKCDKLNATERKKLSAAAAENGDILFSSKTGDGKDNVWRAIDAMCAG